MSETPEPARLPRRRRYLVRGLLALASILAAVSIFALWANRQVLDENNWANTSSQLLDHPAIRGQIAQTAVDQVYANVDVAGQVESALPPRLKPLAGPAANGLRELAQKRITMALGRPRGQQLWAEANRLTAQQFINIAEGNSKAVTRQGNAVILDLRVIVLDLAQRLGLPATVVNRIPSGAAKVKIMDGNQVGALQDSVNAVRGLGVVLPLLSFFLLGLAVFLSGPRRRETLLAAGLNLIGVGLFILILRRVMGGSVVDSLAKTDAVRPAAQATWDIGTSMLRHIAAATIVIGLPIVGAAWLAGPRKPARELRRWMAPTLRDRPSIAYAVVGVIVLLILAWGPIQATREPISIALIIILAFWGTAVLGRQVTREYPDELPGAVNAQVRARVSGAVKARQDRRAGLPATTVAATPASGKLDMLEKLGTLHDQGVLTDEEFAHEKAALINGSQLAAS